MRFPQRIGPRALNYRMICTNYTDSMSKMSDLVSDRLARASDHKYGSRPSETIPSACFSSVM
jgi:hypothetical protein